MKTAMRFGAFLCALLLLTACGATQQPLVRTELIEVPVVEYAAIPAALTAPLVAPAPPPLDCKLPTGKATPCVFDTLLREAAWQAVLDRANEDRATTAKITLNATLQPPLNPRRLEPFLSHQVSQHGAITASGAEP